MNQHGGELNPFFREGLYEDAGSLGDEIRHWPQYTMAMRVIRLWLKKHDARMQEHEQEKERARTVREQDQAAPTS